MRISPILSRGSALPSARRRREASRVAHRPHLQIKCSSSDLKGLRKKKTVLVQKLSSVEDWGSRAIQALAIAHPEALTLSSVRGNCAGLNLDQSRVQIKKFLKIDERLGGWDWEDMEKPVNITLRELVDLLIFESTPKNQAQQRTLKQLLIVIAGQERDTQTKALRKHRALTPEEYIILVGLSSNLKILNDWVLFWEKYLTGKRQFDEKDIPTGRPSGIEHEQRVLPMSIIMEKIDRCVSATQWPWLKIR